MRRDLVNFAGSLWPNRLLVALSMLIVAPAYATEGSLDQYQQFRDAVIGFVRADALAYIQEKPGPVFTNSAFDHEGRWTTEVSVYLDGELAGKGQARAHLLAQALHSATMTALSGEVLLEPGQIDRASFLVSLEYPPRRVASIIEYRGQGLELLGDVVAVRTLDHTVIEQQLARARKYLLNVMDPRLHGFPKNYDAATDTAEKYLRTIYTASSLYTLLKLNAWKFDPDTEAQVTPIADYLLSMQCNEGPCRGAFHYAYFPLENRRDGRFMVGTASKTIFTLIELWHKTHDQRYLDSASLAADWLVSMVNRDGTVNAGLERKDAKWEKETRFSLLYSGQTLSALSRLYLVNPEERYRKAADRIAKLFRNRLSNAQGRLLGDDYREPNSVSTSWAAKALYDYSRINNDPTNHNLVFRAFDAVLANQVDTPYDPYYDGSFFDNPSSSGTGWVNEVLIDVNHLCREDGRGDCDRYRNAMVHASRWLIQRSYSEPDTFAVKNPARALGGAIRKYDDTVVRTDAVCHGSNSLIGLLEVAGDDVYLALPPRPFNQFFRALRLSAGSD